MFELSEERFIRGRLSESLKYVVSQRLMPKAKGGKIAAFEVLVNNLRIRELILNGEDGEKNFYEVLHSSSAYGMHTFDDYLYQLYREGAITESVAMLNASEKARLGQLIDKLKAEQGEKVTDIDGLELDEDYDQRIREGL
jgi:twitching motility protein PilT